MTRSLLETWWDRDTQRRRASMIKENPLPSDGASWVVMVNFFGVVGMADARIRTPAYINPLPIMEKYLALREAEKVKK